jgi:hypothetical protein
MTICHRDWTQHEIVKQADWRRSILEKQEGEHSGFFQILRTVTDEAFGGTLVYDPRQWVFPMNDLFVGQVIDFFLAHNEAPAVTWHKNDEEQPDAYIGIASDDVAAALRSQFGLEPELTPASTDDEILDFHQDQYRGGRFQRRLKKDD